MDIGSLFVAPVMSRQCGVGTWRKRWGSHLAPQILFVCFSDHCLSFEQVTLPLWTLLSWFQIGCSCRCVGRFKRKHLPVKSHQWKSIQVLFSLRFILYFFFFFKTHRKMVVRFFSSATHFLSQSLCPVLSLPGWHPVYFSQIAISHQSLWLELIGKAGTRRKRWISVFGGRAKGGSKRRASTIEFTLRAGGDRNIDVLMFL